MLEQNTPKLSKAESARINGAKSNGPTTAEGKSNSAKANLKHGAYASRVLIEGEDPAFYQAMKDYYVDLFLPQDAFEAECVTSMVTARWRIRRMESAEAANLEIALATNKEPNAARFKTLGVMHQHGVAVQCEMESIDRGTKVEERLHRIYERNYKMLTHYRRKPNNSIPAESMAADSPVPEVHIPTPPEPEPVPPPSNVKHDPNPDPNPTPAPAPLAATLSIFLALFTLLLLNPTSATAEKRSLALVPSFYGSPSRLTHLNIPGVPQ